MKCIKCGYEGEGNFCPKCGTKLSENGRIVAKEDAKQEKDGKDIAEKEIEGKNIEENDVEEKNVESIDVERKEIEGKEIEDTKDKKETHRQYSYATIRQWVIMISGICVGIWMLFHGSIWQALFLVLGGILMGPQVQMKFPGIKGYLLDCAAILLVAIAAQSVQAKSNAIDAVKGGTPESYPNITYGKAFDNYFVEPKWNYLGEEENDTGNYYIGFTGECYQEDQAVDTEVEFTVYGDTFEITRLSLNNLEMDDYSIYGFMEDVFESY